MLIAIICEGAYLNTGIIKYTGYLFDNNLTFTYYYSNKKDLIYELNLADDYKENLDHLYKKHSKLLLPEGAGRSVGYKG